MSERTLEPDMSWLRIVCYDLKLLPEGYVRKCGFSLRRTIQLSPAALTSHAYSHRQPHAYDMACVLGFDAKWAYQGTESLVIGRKRTMF